MKTTTRATVLIAVQLDFVADVESRYVDQCVQKIESIFRHGTILDALQSEGIPYNHVTAHEPELTLDVAGTTVSTLKGE